MADMTLQALSSRGMARPDRTLLGLTDTTRLVPTRHDSTERDPTDSTRLDLALHVLTRRGSTRPTRLGISGRDISGRDIDGTRQDRPDSTWLAMTGLIRMRPTRLDGTERASASHDYTRRDRHD